jgi:circadian clock protein KaiC
MDTWLLLRNAEVNGERTRSVSVMKSRGMAHSNQLREFIMTKNGLALVDSVRDDSGGVLTGSRRTARDLSAPVRHGNGQRANGGGVKAR